MSFQVTVLGTTAAIPTKSKAPTAQVISVNQSLLLIDCAEGTQTQMRKYGIKMQRIGAIFISHMHGDHYFGLVGLINTMNLLKRKAPLHIYGPPELKKIIELQFKAAKSYPVFNITFHDLEFDASRQIYADSNITVTTIPLKHRIPCNGFLIEEKPKPRKIKPQEIERYGIPREKIKDIKSGSNYKTKTGEVIKNEVLTETPPTPLKYAYCSDTKYTEKIIPIIENCDLLYHEATFTNREAQRAADTFHSTAAQTAAIALKAHVKQLLLGHFSTRYKSTDTHLEEARAIFDNTVCAEQGETYVL